MACSVTFELVDPKPEDVARHLQRSIASLGGMSGGLLFLCGEPTRLPMQFALAASDIIQAPMGVACGAGVLSSRGDHHQESAAVGLIWRGARCSPFWFDVQSEPDGAAIGSQVMQQSVHSLAGDRGAVVLLAQPEVFPPCTGAAIRFSQDSSIRLFGGGVLSRPGAIVVEPGAIHQADVIGLAIHDPTPPLVRVSVGCRLLGSLQPVTRVDGPVVLQIGQRSAIDELKDQARKSHRRELLVVAIELGRDHHPERPQLMLRGIRGIHEQRGGLVISDEVSLGTSIAFAVRDPVAARLDLEATLREMEREMAGSVPRFGIYFDCAGRGPDMYGTNGVDVELIRNRWPSMPFVGLRSAFEIGPTISGQAVHLYSGVMSVFRSVS